MKQCFPEGGSEQKKRIILDSPFFSRNTVSYGLIVHSLKTKRWLIVKRKHSTDFLFFMNGAYRISQLPFMIKNITDGERETALRCLEDMEFFSKIYIDDLGLDADGLENAKIRMKESKDFAKALLNTLQLRHNEIKWTWPKGNPQSCARGENPFDCALREFEEKVEAKLPSPSFLPDSYIVETMRTINGVNLESRYWVYVIDEEIPVHTPISHMEVSDRKWASTKECAEVTNEDLLNRAIEMILEM